MHSHGPLLIVRKNFKVLDLLRKSYPSSCFVAGGKFWAEARAELRAEACAELRVKACAEPRAGVRTCRCADVQTCRRSYGRL